MPNQFPLTATLLACLVILPCSGQETGSAKRIRAKRMEIPRYLPLAQQAGRSGEVTLYLTVSTAGKVVAVDIVHAQPSGWGRGFAAMAIDAAKQSEFECTSCSGDAFEHIVTYQFRFPAIPRNACTLNPPIPASNVDSGSHVTVRPRHWPCVTP